MKIVWRWFQRLVDLARVCFSMGVLVWQGQRLISLGLLAVNCLQGLLPLATAWLMKVFFDTLGRSIVQRQAGPPLAQTLVFLLIAQMALIIVTQALNPVQMYLGAELERRLSLKIKTTLYQKLNSFIGLAYFEDQEFQNKIQMVANKAQVSPLQFITMLTNLVQGLVTVVAFLSVLLAFNALLAGIIAVAVIPQLYLQLKFSQQHFLVAFNNTPQERRAWYYGQVLSWASFAKEIRLFNLGGYFLQSFLNVTRQIQQQQRAQQQKEIRWRLVLSVFTGMVTSGAFVVVIWQAFTGQLSIGDVALYINVVTSIQGVLLSVVLALSQVSEQALFYNQYLELLALPLSHSAGRATKAVPALTSGITIDNVSFRYSDEQEWILRHVTLFLPAGHCLALVGLNGAGKTTLVKLLTRLYDPTEGHILWDGIDIREFDPGELRQHLGAIFQDFARYDLAAQHNIGLGDVAHIENNEAVQKAAIKADVHERILALPQGYQSVLGRGFAVDGPGIDLSGGEWQKIALARMFMREADVLILDEPTAALDAQAEYELYRQFSELMRGRTSLLITHRFSTVRMAETIAVIENGQITEYGRHSDLVACGGTYAKLYTMQAEHYQK